VRAQFDDAPAMQHGDAIRIAHRWRPVGNEDVVRPRNYIAQVLKNFVFSVGVDARERVVKDQNPGLRMSARAIAVRCFCPPESVMPRSPTMVS